jgi:hypothetical protein
MQLCLGLNGETGDVAAYGAQNMSMVATGTGRLTRPGDLRILPPERAVP